MLFNSIEYVLFLAIVAGLFRLASPRIRWFVLLVASYAFYISWNVAYLGLLLSATVASYLVGLVLERSRAAIGRWCVLALGVGFNLGLLFLFKYWDFFNTAAQGLLQVDAGDWRVPGFAFLLPIGISFYTFQTVSYMVDVFRQRLSAEPHFGRFALFVAFFPQLVAGPIERAGDLLPQLAQPRRWTNDGFLAACTLILWGLFKKVVIADRCAVYVDSVYGNLTVYDGASYLLATYAYACQIYCDFSGYCDVAVGSAALFGIRLSENFRRPYFARSVREFWHRWHISLSTWFRDYVYIPLGGNRHGPWRLVSSLLITMALVGLWHGASWNFVVWGVLHGVALVVLRVTNRPRRWLYRRLFIPPVLLGAVQWFVTFHFICFSWIIFRAETLSEAWLIMLGIGRRFGTPFVDALPMAHALLGLLFLVGLEASFEWKDLFPAIHIRLQRIPQWAVCYLLVFAVLLLGAEEGRQFVYFQF